MPHDDGYRPPRRYTLTDYVLLGGIVFVAATVTYVVIVGVISLFR